MTPTRHRGGSPTTSADTPAATRSLSDLARQPEIQLALDNNAFLRVAENVIYLRRYRELTQEALAKRVKTSQAAIARVEGACENVTLRTLEKIVTALEGRLQLSISPAEVHLPTLPNWWDLIAHGIDADQPYACAFVLKQERDPVHVGAGWISNATGAFEQIAVGTAVVGAPPVSRELCAPHRQTKEVA